MHKCLIINSLINQMEQAKARSLKKELRFVKNLFQQELTKKLFVATFRM